MNKLIKNPLYTGLNALLCFGFAGILTYLLVSAYNMGPTPIDLAVLEFMVSIRNDFLNMVVSFITHCGDTITIVALCAILVILPTRKKYGFPVTISALLGLAIYKPMKHVFLRARPDVMYHIVEQGGYSFPSGHTTSSIIVYGILLYLIRKHCKNETLKNILSAVCLVFIFCIGPSRLYVGVHWFTDVLAGAFIAMGVLNVVITVLERIYDKNESL
ncbi:MAG: phosphatase PAP2 family protein [Firmicutes bacterium]|nr:phosphatase PAP2 family protein [Bacillota bacterium]